MRHRLAAWLRGARPAAAGAARGAGERWVVIDVETSGLDPAHDRLLAVAALGLHRAPGEAPRIVVGDSFEVVVRQDEPSPGPAERGVAAPPAVDKGNILLHGIGVGAQRAGVDPAVGLAALERWLDGAPRIAFHAAFDRTMIQRAMRDRLGRALPGDWVDLADVAAVLVPQVRARSLDDWLEHYAITCLQRHQAAADALATAELLLRLWPALRAQRSGDDFAALRRLAAGRRWLERGGER